MVTARNTAWKAVPVGASIATTSGTLLSTRMPGLGDTEHRRHDDRGAEAHERVLIAARRAGRLGQVISAVSRPRAATPGSATASTR
jgi:hypothetical protein